MSDESTEELWIWLPFVRAVIGLPRRAVSHSERAVLYQLAFFANERGISDESIDYMADRCSLSREAVLRAVNGLERKGFIRVNRYARGPGVKRRRSGYQLCGEWLRSATIEVERMVAQRALMVAQRNLPKVKESESSHEKKRRVISGGRNGAEDPHAGLPNRFVEQLKRRKG